MGRPIGSKNKNTSSVKTEMWKMRMTRTDKTNIKKLARRLNVKQSEAMRRAVNIALEITQGEKAHAN